jgi:hypothetical protein
MTIEDIQLTQEQKEAIERAAIATNQTYDHVLVTVFTALNAFRRSEIPLEIPALLEKELNG